jgi:hypothetical protein
MAVGGQLHFIFIFAFTVLYSALWPRNIFMYFYDSRSKPIISLNDTNRFIFVMENCCFLFGVEHESIIII